MNIVYIIFSVKLIVIILKNIENISKLFTLYIFMSKEYFTSLQKQEIYSKKPTFFKKTIKCFNLTEFFCKKLEKSAHFRSWICRWYFCWLQKFRVQVLGLDINQSNLETDKIFLENNSCDLITANSLIEHISNPKIFARM